MKINITLPVYNEEKILTKSVNTLIKFLAKTKFPYNYEIVIADNASTDNTPKIAKTLTKRYSQVKYLHVPQKGRGRALKRSWTKTNCEISSYMDIDLSSDLKSFLPLIKTIVKDECQVATGSRLHKKSLVIGRSTIREILSRVYNIMITSMFFAKFKDAQCGFKAINTKYFKSIVKNVKNNEWFFDTELLLISNHLSKKIGIVPIKWKDDSDSRVKLVKTIKEDLKGLSRLKVKFIFDKKFYLKQ